jgi:hypothetical protein
MAVKSTMIYIENQTLNSTKFGGCPGRVPSQNQSSRRAYRVLLLKCLTCPRPRPSSGGGRRKGPLPICRRDELVAHCLEIDGDHLLDGLIAEAQRQGSRGQVGVGSICPLRALNSSAYFYEIFCEFASGGGRSFKSSRAHARA